MIIKAEEHMPMAYKIALKFYEKNTGNDFEEIYSDALLGLAMAASRFDASKGLKFSTYAYSTITGILKTSFFRNESKFRRRYIDGKEVLERVCWTSLNETTGEKEDLERLDLLEEETLVEDCIDSIFVKDLLNSLDERERKVIIDNLYKEKSQLEISKELGISQITVSRIKNRALNKLRKQICA